MNEIDMQLQEAIHEMLKIEFNRDELRIAIPVLIAEYVFAQYIDITLPINFKSAEYMGIKLVEGYEKAIVVYHKDSAIYKHLKPIKIELNL